MITHIIWDYNGTVVDDVDMSVAAVNNMLEKRGLPHTDKDTYKETLTMPLLDYYCNLGVTDKKIEELSVEFHDTCLEFSHLTKIFNDFRATAEYAKKLGIKNILMSSLYNKYLNEEIDKYEIRDCFDKVIGMHDTGVGSKTDNAKKYITENNLDVKNVLFIGDLTTDAQMAKAIGAKCILIPNGHNSEHRCKKEGVTVLENISCIKKYLANN